MSANINKVMITGNLTRDPELRADAGATPLLRIGVAVNDSRRNPQTQQWEDVPNFIDCTIWGSRAEGLSRILHKGMKVAIDGKLRYSTWERDGQKRSKLEVNVDHIDFVSPRNGQGTPTSAPAAAASAPAAAPAAATPPAATEAADLYDQSMPF